MDDLEECVRNAYPRLIGAVRAAGASQADAEDALQEACAKALERNRHGRESLRHPEAWLVTVALNHLRSTVRRQRRLVAMPTELGSVPSRDDGLIDLEVALAQLPRRQQQVVLCHYYFGLRTRETAVVLGVGEGTVKTALHRARQRLGAALAPAWEGDAVT